MKVLYLTGYKAHELGIFKNNHEGVQYIKKAIKQRLIPLVEDGLEWVIISGQLGSELWGAEVVLEIKMEHPHLKLGVLTPFLNQEESWNETNQDYYRSITAGADFLESIFKKPYEGPQQLRIKNSYMVHKSDAMMIVYDPDRDGSAKYAYNEGMKKADSTLYPIFEITFDDLQQAAQEDNWADY